MWLEEAEQELIEENIRKIWDLKHNETNRECSWKQFPMGAEDCVVGYSHYMKNLIFFLISELFPMYSSPRIDIDSSSSC